MIGVAIVRDNGTEEPIGIILIRALARKVHLICPILLLFDTNKFSVKQGWAGTGTTGTCLMVMALAPNVSLLVLQSACTSCWENRTWKPG